ncbi:hypothetical protein M0802_006495 [Mischocyttarus mexicanus]|nr:hypothetical protein M0802_006495 [Mischocyttarus mexicanus]
MMEVMVVMVGSKLRGRDHNLYNGLAKFYPESSGDSDSVGVDVGGSSGGGGCDGGGIVQRDGENVEERKDETSTTPAVTTITTTITNTTTNTTTSSTTTTTTTTVWQELVEAGRLRRQRQRQQGRYCATKDEGAGRQKLVSTEKPYRRLENRIPTVLAILLQTRGMLATARLTAANSIHGGLGSLTRGHQRPRRNPSL